LDTLLPIVDSEEELRAHDLGGIGTPIAELRLPIRLLQRVHDIEIDTETTVDII
jgi:hypothetical protein